jgi:hypothetical protein
VIVRARVWNQCPERATQGDDRRNPLDHSVTVTVLVPPPLAQSKGTFLKAGMGQCAGMSPERPGYRRQDFGGGLTYQVIPVHRK